MHTGNGEQIFNHWVIARTKPLLWFVKGKKIMNGIDSMKDIIVSEAPNKDYHNWQQSTVETEYCINRLTVGENQIVMDPMLGSGTTAISALKLNRKFIGIEIDPETFEIAKARITI